MQFISVIYLSVYSAFEDFYHIYHTHSSKLHSFLWMWTLRPHFSAKMFDVGDLPVLTFGNCVLKTRVTKWLLKLYGRFLRFFSKSKNMTFYVDLSCCTRRLEHCYHCISRKHAASTQTVLSSDSVAVSKLRLKTFLFSRAFSLPSSQ